MDYAARRVRLLENRDVDAFLIFDLDRTMPSQMDRSNMQYLSGYAGEGALLITSGETVLLTDSRYLEQAKQQVPKLPLVHAEGKYYEELERVIHDRGLKRIGYAAWRTTDYVLGRLSEIPGTEWIPFDDPVTELRAVKDAEELTALREAIQLAEKALAHLRDTVEVGMNEVDVAAALSSKLRELGSERVAFGPTVASGPNSALPHYRPSLNPRLLERGDLLLIDFGAVVDGYVSDITRTFAIGKTTEKQREIYAIVLESLQAGIDAMRAGIPGDVPHEAAQRVIEGSPYAEHVFLSPLGHGVGLEVHELPKMGLNKGEILEPGMVVTVEPGIYIPGYGGVRIEETVRVTETGCEVLTSFPKDSLIEVGG
jgi:Xaa-Pro aminopeptidase